jgi:hypothetical protein
MTILVLSMLTSASKLNSIHVIVIYNGGVASTNYSKQNKTTTPSKNKQDQTTITTLSQNYASEWSHMYPCELFLM